MPFRRSFNSQLLRLDSLIKIEGTAESTGYHILQRNASHLLGMFGLCRLPEGRQILHFQYRLPAQGESPHHCSKRAAQKTAHDQHIEWRGGIATEQVIHHLGQAIALEGLRDRHRILCDSYGGDLRHELHPHLRDSRAREEVEGHVMRI